MFYNDINPVLMNIGPFAIRYYGIIYALGFIIAYLFFRHYSKSGKLKMDLEDIDTYFLYLIVGVVIGARIFEVVIYNVPYYWTHPFESFYIWNGGLSFHGGLIGAIIVTYIFAKRHKLHFYDLADRLVIPTSIALFLGRIANFINSEVYGTVADPNATPWCVVFKKVDNYCRHPTQLYESAKNLVLFAMLTIYDQKKRVKGTLFWMFITFYGLFRFIITFWRDEPLYFGLNVGQWACLAMIIVGSYFLWKLNKAKRKDI